MRKEVTFLLIITLLALLIPMFNGCKVSSEITAKTGEEIWVESCIRCHNLTAPQTFSDVEWDIAGMHMQIRANLTPEETKKVIEFLQSAN